MQSTHLSDYQSVTAERVSWGQIEYALKFCLNVFWEYLVLAENDDAIAAFEE